MHSLWYCPETNKPQKRFTTIPIGPVIQSLYSSHDVADRMHYLEGTTSRALAPMDRLNMRGLP